MHDNMAKQKGKEIMTANDDSMFCPIYLYIYFFSFFVLGLESAL